MAIDHVLYPTKKKEESICFHTGDLLYFSSTLQPHCLNPNPTQIAFVDPFVSEAIAQCTKYS